MAKILTTAILDVTGDRWLAELPTYDCGLCLPKSTDSEIGIDSEINPNEVRICKSMVNSYTS